MEDTLRDYLCNYCGWHFYVLILVLMEDTLRVVLEKIIIVIKIGLNPCFNGRYSQSNTSTRNTYISSRS